MTNERADVPNLARDLEEELSLAIGVYVDARFEYDALAAINGVTATTLDDARERLERAKAAKERSIVRIERLAVTAYDFAH